MTGIRRYTKTIVLTDGTSATIELADAMIPLTVFARPASGDTVSIEYSCDGGTTYTAWSAGAVTAYAESVFDAPITHLKGQRTAGAGTTSAFGVC
jgi:hypothetical protein